MCSMSSAADLLNVVCGKGLRRCFQSYVLQIRLMVGRANPFPNVDTFRRILKTLWLHNNNWKRLKTLWQREKLLIMSNFSFCPNVFKSRLLQMRQKASLCGKACWPEGLQYEINREMSCFSWQLAAAWMHEVLQPFFAGNSYNWMPTD